MGSSQYETLGLLKNVMRDKNGKRIYNDCHLERLEGIQCFKAGGLPIAKICEFYQYDDHLDEHIEDIINLLDEHEESLSEQIAAMQKQLLHIRHKIRYYHGIKAAIESGEEWPCFDEFK